MFSEDDLLPISALQHLAFCPRQWGLIHIEQVWTENYLTAEGRVLHEKTHSAESENRPGLRIARGLRLHSLRLGLVGQADVVEFIRLPKDAEGGIRLEGAEGLWQPVPVEYKRGSPKISRCDELQLCAQTICLEEMLDTTINTGAIYYGRPRRRKEVDIDATLRQETEKLVFELHRLTDSQKVPTAKYEKKCKSCSLLEFCMPKVAGIKKDIEHYLSKAKDETIT
jgi:CRISPR-associated exonuclease Cas4